MGISLGSHVLLCLFQVVFDDGAKAIVFCESGVNRCHFGITRFVAVEIGDRSSIKSLKWGHVYGRMVRRIVPIFRQV